MKSHYDMVFITHLPAFYKVNLYNQIAKHCHIYVIFISDASTIRTADFTNASYNFEHCILNKTSFEKRHVGLSLWRLWRALKQLSFKKLIVGGWELPEFWLAAFYSGYEQNQLALESSLFESNIQGLRYWIKKLFLRRISLVYASGKPHQELLQTLRYQADIKTTKGVGLFNYFPRNLASKKFSGKFLFVGRLAPEKNIEILLNVFAQLPHFSLTLVGQGPLQGILEKIKTANVKIIGHVSNENLAQIYHEHDVLVLPSKREPWGLVVEEALYYGLPVIVSDKVGSGHDLVLEQKVGTSFEFNNPMSLGASILWMCQHFDECLNNIALIDFAKKDALQIQQYLEACS